MKLNSLATKPNLLEVKFARPILQLLSIKQNYIIDNVQLQTNSNECKKLKF